MLLGLTGGVATGKSTFAQLLSERAEFLCFDADACVHELLATDRGVAEAVRREFGLDGPPVERRALREIVFRDSGARRRLEAILHPPVRARWQALAADARATGRRLLADIPLLFETGAADFFDVTVVVAAAPGVQRRRLAARGLEPATIDGMLASQLAMREKVTRAGIVVWNDGSLGALARQADLLLENLLPPQS
jgi:dephospho-CoA kinase